MVKVIPPTWLQAKEDQIWLMCDACRDQQRQWYVMAFGGEVSTSDVEAAVENHLESHSVVAASNDVENVIEEQERSGTVTM